MSIVQGIRVAVPFQINQTDLLAGTSHEMIAPITGYIRAISTTVQVAITTGGVVTVENAGDAVAGASITVADAATKGTIQTAAATPEGTYQAVTQGDRVEVIPSAAFATAGALNGYVEFSSAL